LKIIPASLAILCPFVAMGAEASQFIKITSPKSGIVVRAGEHLTMAVDATPHAFAEVTALAFFAGSSSGPPYEFAITVPFDMEPGLHTVVVFGIPASGLKDIKSDKDLVQDEIDLRRRADRQSSEY
jgi:hypothetical protein